jgi:thermitase
MISKLLIALACILMLIQPMSAKDLNLTSDFSTNQSLQPILPDITISPQNDTPDSTPSQISGSDTGNSPVTITSDPVTNRKYVSDRVIVRFKPRDNANLSISNDDITRAHAKDGAKVKTDFGSLGISGLQVVQLPPGTDVQTAISDYQSNPDVLYAEPDYVISLFPDENEPLVQDSNPIQILATPNDPNFTELWGLHNTGQTILGTSGRAGADINASRAWDISTGSNSIIVAVVDTGVNYNHSDLSANIWTNPGEIPGNGIDDDHNGYIDDVHGWNFLTNTSDPLDDNGHGTHVSGTIGAVGNNGIGVAGVNWHVRIMPLKFLNFEGSGSTSGAISSILYANANGASVISNSWASTNFSQPLKDVIDASPAVVVCAAGNDGGNNDIIDVVKHTPQYPASYTSANIISVAATNQTDQRASFSNYGAISVDLAAPGTNILSTDFSGGYSYKQGTSMATPHVSGVAALVKSVNPQLTNVEIKKIILDHVDVLPSLAGLVNTSGRLNAYKSVLAAQSYPIANFSGTPTNGVAPFTVTFTDLSINGPGTWNWTFGDGNVTNATIQNPVHTYLSPGTYNVSLNVTNSQGFDNVTKSGYIVVTRLPTSKVGVYKDGVWYLDYNGNGRWDGASVDRNYNFGGPGNVSLTGDWNGDNKTEIGVTNGADWYLDINRDGVWNPAQDQHCFFGVIGYTPVVGDWTGNGTTKIGETNGADWYLDTNANGIYDGPSVDKHGFFGVVGYSPIVGDWTGNGTTKIGVTNGADWYLDANGDGVWNATQDIHGFFGVVGYTPIVGDWTGNGTTRIGVTNGADWYLDINGNGRWDGPSIDKHGFFGVVGYTPIVGDWAGNGSTRIAVTNSANWYLDLNGNCIWDGPAIDQAPFFGVTGFTPLAGKWN